MRSRDEVSFRLGLAQGFLAEAEQDVGLERWRSCVDNSQLAAENAGKAILALFGVPPKTHEPARQLVELLDTSDVPPEMQEQIRSILPDLIALGMTEHFMTDYGDETTYTLPWELFTSESAKEALEKARRAVTAAKEAIRAVRSVETGNPQ